MYYTVYVKNDEIFYEVRERLSKIGLSVPDTPPSQGNHFINIYPDLSMTFLSSSEFFVVNRWNSPEFKCITLKELYKMIYEEIEKRKVQEKMITVDGKEYSESTIKKALQEYVK